MLSKQNSLLHIIDVQEKLFNVMYEKEALKDNMVRLVKGVQVLEIPVLWMEQYPQGLGKTIPELGQLLQNQEPLEKMCFSSCRSSNFMAEITKLGKTQVILIGIETHVCVYQTAADLLSNGFEVSVVADAVSSRTAFNYETGLRAMESLGVKITSVEMALFELLKETGTDEFRKISRIIK